MQIKRIMTVALAIGLAAPGIATAHFMDGHGRWSFGGRELAKVGGTASNPVFDPRTPINVIFYPNAYEDGSTKDTHMDVIRQRLAAHLAGTSYHTTDDRGLGSDALGTDACTPDRRYLDFPSGGATKVKNDDNLVIWKPQDADNPDRCRNRYHGRVWFDDHHFLPSGGTGPHTDVDKRWIVAQFHREVGGVDTNHNLNAPSQLVEARLIHFFRLTNSDPAARQQSCSTLHWRKLPGSMGWHGDKTLNDGILTRIDPESFCSHQQPVQTR